MVATTLSTSFLFISFALLASFTNACNGPATYNRLVIVTVDANLGPNWSSDTNDVLGRILDTNQSRMIGSGLYTQQQANAFKADAFDYCLTGYGFDFSQGVTQPNGMIFLPGVMLLPYAVDTFGQPDDLILAYDSSHGGVRGTSGDWFAKQYGYIAIMLTDGVFPGGYYSNQTYVAGSLVGLFDYNLLDMSHPRINRNDREVLRCKSTYPSQTVVNNQGFSDFYAKLEVVDSHGNVGVYDDLVVYERDVRGNVISRTRAVFAWK